MKKYLCTVIALLMVITVFTGCHEAEKPLVPDNRDKFTEKPADNKTEEPSTSEPHKKVDTIICALEADVESLSPVEVPTSNSNNVYALIYEQLFHLEADGETVTPVLVESYELVNDTTYNMKLKEGILFHDGSEMTAEDVKASLDWSSTWPVPRNHKRTIEVTGKYTFTITTPEPDGLLLADDLSVKWNSIVPKALIENGNDFKVNPIGSGPYKYVERATAEWIKFESFDGYRKDPLTDNRVKYVILKIIPDSTARTMALQNGDINYNPYVEVMDIDRLVEDENIEVLETEGGRFYNLTLNTSRAPFDNINVRKAIAYAIDPEAAIVAALDGRGEVMRGLVNDTSIGSTHAGRITYDVEKAKEYLAQSGYKPGEINMKILATNAIGTRMAESVIEDLSEIGINAVIQNVEHAVMVSDTAQGNFDSVLIGNTTTTVYTVLWMNYGKAAGAQNRTYMSNARYDEIFEKLIPTTMDYTVLSSLYEEAIAIAQEYCGIVPICKDKTYTAYSKDLSNVHRGLAARSYIPWIVPVE